jgi:pimeloyl-ACP methyl ester carboxylesterase
LRQVAKSGRRRARGRLFSPRAGGGHRPPQLLQAGPEHAERLAQDLPDARIEWIEKARSLSPEDAPARLAELIAAFVRETASRATV